MRTIPDELSAIASRQSGVLHHAQLVQFGFRVRDVDRRIAAGLWQRVSSRVVVAHALPAPRLAMLWAAALHHDRVGLTGAAALEVDGLPPEKNARIDLLGPHGERRVPFDGCRLMTSTTPLSLVTADGPPRTALPLSVAYAMANAGSPRQAAFYATWSVQRRLVSLDEIRLTISVQARSPRMVTARRVLDSVDPGVHSIHEYDFARECVRRGLPRPVRQMERIDSRGQRRYTDVEFRVGARTVVVEVDGLGHLEASVFVDDQWRSNELALQDAKVLRIPGLALRTDPEPFFAQLRRALRDAAAA